MIETLPQLTIEQSHRVWGAMLVVYGGAAFFHKSIVRKMAACFCWMSCAFGLLIFHTSHYVQEFITESTNMLLPVGYFLYSIADITVLLLIYKTYRKRFNKLCLLFLASITTHLVAVFSDVVGFSVFFNLYEYIMVFINVLIIGILFNGSYGHRAIHKCFLYCKRDRHSSENVQNKKGFHGGSL